MRGKLSRQGDNSNNYNRQVVLYSILALSSYYGTTVVVVD
jgi:hypothetical protein